MRAHISLGLSFRDHLGFDHEPSVKGLIGFKFFPRKNSGFDLDPGVKNRSKGLNI